MYQALYRKWRPKTFDEVVGQEHITETLKNQVMTGRLSHAYLFIGTRGTGKTTCAKILAKAVNCEHPVNGNPCGKCPACLGIEDGSVMDIVELDAASNNGVDNVRALRDEAVFSPASVKKRVYIVDEVHMLSTPAFNALLKILEEPPEHLMFILATTELNKVPATILSRCQRHSFRRLAPEVIAKHLEYVASQEKFDLEHDAAELIARLAEGGMRDALSLLDQASGSEHITVDTVYSCMGLAGKRAVAEMLGFVAAHDTASALTGFQAMWQDGRDPATILNELSSLMRDTLMTIVAPKGCGELLSGGYDAGTLRDFSKKLTSAELISMMGAIQQSLSSMRTAGNPKTAAELCLVSLCEPQLSDGIQELRARVARLENAVSGGIPAAVPAIKEAAPEPPAKPEPAPQPKPAPSPKPSQALDPAPAPKPEPTPEPEPDDGPEPESAPPYTDEELPPAEDEPCEDYARDEVPVDDDAPIPETQAPSDADAGWDAIARRVEDLLPPGLRIYLDDSSVICGTLDGDNLRLSAEPGFIYGQFGAPKVLLSFHQAAGDVLGRPINVTISEMNGGGEAARRDIEELKKFKEVHITGGK